MKRKKKGKLEMVFSRVGECTGCAFEKKRTVCAKHPCIIDNSVCVKYRYSH